MTRPLTQQDIAKAHEWGRNVLPFYRNVKVAPGFVTDATTARHLLEDCLRVHHGDYRDLNVSDADKARLCEISLHEALHWINDDPTQTHHDLLSNKQMDRN